MILKAGAPTHKHLGPTSVEQPESPDEEPAPPEKLKVGVVGGSIAGLVAARALLDVGCDVEVFEMNSLENLLVGPGCFLLQVRDDFSSQSCTVTNL